MTDARHWRRIVGIDPGAHGGIVTLCPVRRGSRSWVVQHVFKLERGEEQIASHLKTILSTGGEEVVYLERVQGWGGGPGLKLMANWGFLRGCIVMCGAKLVDVYPQAWMKAMYVTGKSQTKEKRESMRLLADGLQNDVTATNWNAAALLIAGYGLKQEGGQLK